MFRFHFHLRTRGMGVSFQASHPHDSSASYRDPIRRSERPGQAHTRSVAQKLVLWGFCHICKNEVSFDVAQDREPVERPFHHLRTNGVSLKRDSRFPYTQHRFWTRVNLRITLPGLLFRAWNACRSAIGRSCSCLHNSLTTEGTFHRFHDPRGFGFIHTGFT